jgi:hypothetical protein
MSGEMVSASIGQGYLGAGRRETETRQRTRYSSGCLCSSWPTFQNEAGNTIEFCWKKKGKH